MFALTLRYPLLPIYMSCSKCLWVIGKYLTSAQRFFMMQHWHSFDVVEYNDGKLCLYEVKVRNEYQKKKNLKPKMTLASYQMYEEAGKAGFEVKVAFVEFLDNWEYNVEVVDLTADSCYVDKPKKYDRV